MKILLLDIETSPMVSMHWGLRNEFISPDHILENSYTLCWAAKWLSKKRILFDSVERSGRISMVKKIQELIEEADAVIHFNGSRFDMPILHQEFLLNDIEPPSTYFDIDLLKTVRNRFNFPSNKLDYVAQRLALGQKVPHKGMALWRGCMDGDAASWKHMEKYNKQDVLLLEKLYEVLKPYIKSHPNFGAYAQTDQPACAKCGSEHLKRNGVERKTTIPYQRYKCLDCHSNLRGRLRIEAPSATTITT